MTGKIDIKDYIEHEDGSATIVFECNDEARQALISEGLLSLIEKAVDKHNEEYNWTAGENKDED
jgi:hypothetical protein